MFARIRKPLDDREQGFTLIELLVVMIIIGILAAIAIPVFLNQRKKAVDSSMKSDLRTVANEMESAYTDTQVYPANATGTAGTITLGTTVIKLSQNNILTTTLNIATSPNAVGSTYCIVATNTAGSHAWVYVSSLGGLQGPTILACPAITTW